MLAVVVVNYKNESKTIDFVKREVSKIKSPHVVIIVNNESTEESDLSLALNLNAKVIHDHENTELDYSNRFYVLSKLENLGFAKGNNCGVEFANRHFDIDYLLLSNNDIVFTSEDVVERLISKLEEMPDIGMIGPAVIGLKGEHQSPEPYYPFSKRYIWRFWLRPFLSKDLSRKFLNQGFSSEAVEGIHYKIMGSFLVIRNADFIACGMMDSNTFLYGEEIILAERMRTLKKSIYYYPQVSVLHEHSATISKFIDKKSKLKLQFESEVYYYKNYKNVSSLLIKVGFISLITFVSFKELLARIRKLN